MKAWICVAMLCLLAGCQTANGSFCDLAKPIRITEAQIDQLSDAQVNQFLGQNEKGAKLCGWKP